MRLRGKVLVEIAIEEIGMENICESLASVLCVTLAQINTLEIFLRLSNTESLFSWKR